MKKRVAVTLFVWVATVVATIQPALAGTGYMD